MAAGYDKLSPPNKNSSNWLCSQKYVNASESVRTSTRIFGETNKLCISEWKKKQLSDNKEKN
jgi:hypothetical protein